MVSPSHLFDFNGLQVFRKYAVVGGQGGAVKRFDWGKYAAPAINSKSKHDCYTTRPARDLVEVKLVDGSSIQGTGNHPVWSKTRHNWVALGELQPGELLQGLAGPVAVQGVRPLPGSGRVYNLEIHGQRVYRIGSPGVLVHNNGGGCPLDDLPPELRQKIHGTAQQTKTPGYAETINRIAAEAAKDPRVVAIHLNHGYNRALELPPKTITPNRRPDAAIIYDDKAVRRIEVPSKSDNPRNLIERHTALDDQPGSGL